MTGNRNANKKEEINEGEMQIESVSRKKIINKINLHWDNWLIYLTTTTVVLIVLQKRNYFRVFVNRQEMQQATPVPSQTNSKKLSKILQQIKNDHQPIETTYSKNNIAHTQISSIITKISKFYPHS